MKIVTTIARLILGLSFTVFGANGFFHFLPMPPLSGYPAQFMTVITVTHYASVIFAAQLVGGLLLLINRFVPLALTILAGVLVNILAYHVFIEPQGLPMAFATIVLWFVVFVRVLPSFRGIFAATGTN
jgi:hypothetical protein